MSDTRATQTIQKSNQLDDALQTIECFKGYAGTYPHERFNDCKITCMNDLGQTSYNAGDEEKI